METNTIEKIEAKDNTLVIPADLLPNLKRNAAFIIGEAKKSGTISTKEISAIIKPQAVSDRYRLKSTVGLLEGFLAQIGLGLARGRVDLQRRQLPIPILHPVYVGATSFHKPEQTYAKLIETVKVEDADMDTSELALYKEIVRKFPVLEHDQTVGLFRQYRQGDLEAHHLLVLHNLKLVFSVALKHQRRGLDLPDLVQEGIIGLMTAIDKFEVDRGNHFSTYALWWIRAKISRALFDKARMIRMPVHFAGKYSAIKSAQRDLIIELGREPSPEEIADRMKLPVRLIMTVLQIATETESHSMNSSVSSDEDSSEQGDLLEDKKTVSPLDMMEAKETLEEVAGEMRTILIRLATLPRFDERYAKIFRMRYGLDGIFFSRPTLEEVGVKFGVTRERIRQVVITCWERLNEIGVEDDDDSFLTKLAQVEELETVTGILTKI